MNYPATTLRIVMALLALVSTHLFAQQVIPQQIIAQQIISQQVFTQKTDDHEISQLVAQSQEALGQHDEQKALSLIRDGLVRFPNDETLQVQLARVYVEQKHDQQAIGLLNAILLADPTNRNAKLELAQIFGYRKNYRESDRLYRELLSASANDEAASLGIVHNLLLEGKKTEARAELQQAFTRNPTILE
jgi:tetratricopeptide (TPR) repeat protein